ncbi:MAG: MFS transporter [Candidatus Izimaplasma sp.]|nr:MFS transporter [Candidatus Izimaplasma bacterium]
MFKLLKLSKKERSWVLYDVANSAFVLTVITILFPLYHIVLPDAPDNAGQLFTFATAGIALVTALLSPVIGSLANYHGNKKKFFIFFLSVGLLGGLGLAIPGFSWLVLIAIFFMSSVGYNIANVLYDAFLVDVTSDERMDEISSTGFAWGYIGSLIPFFIGIIPFGLVELGFIDDKYFQLTISFAFIVTFIWWLGYSIPMLKDVDQTYNIEHEPHAIRKSLLRIWNTFKEISTYKNIFIFMVAYLLYIDVVNTVIRLATTIGSQLNVGNPVLLGVVIVVQFIAFPCAIIYGRLAKKFGGKPMLFYGIFMYAATIIIVSLIVEGREYLMWVVAILIGSAQGGIQAVSRSFFAKMLPIQKANEFFGFFSVFGKFSGIFSPFLLGSLMAFTTANRAVLVLLFPLTLGAIVLIFVKEEKAEYVPR